MHLGALLPNYGPDSSPDGIRAAAEAAEEAGFDSIWTTEHLVIGPDSPQIYRRVYDSLLTLAWIAGWTERIGLGTSVVLLALHDPFRLAKEATTLQELSGGRLTLGVGLGSQGSEFEIMGVDSRGRGRRADEEIRLLRALWAGESSFAGEVWSFAEAHAEPHPRPAPEIWVGGSSDRAVRRARELGDAWHPSGGSDPDHVRAVKERHPELRIVPRTSPERFEEMLDAGAEGAVLGFDGVDSLRAFAKRYR
ncbi:MAG TPA: TIGR03619 family F420-dependent LLM class oxidoreductase [Gaiellaceae bacterium]|nr:TIGR03619 family F420-dependent LLM class oxidoreductase [Gaiellaceae bacterium]